jgi:drug/metabolite transporter (DMT)-like permease
MGIVNFVLILAGVLLNAAAQVLLKKGMMIIGSVQPSIEAVLAMLPKLAVNACIWAGMACYGISVLVWLIVLSKVEVSYAYPFLSIGYIVTAFVGWHFLGESMGIYKICGIAVICLGIGLLYKS